MAVAGRRRAIRPLWATAAAGSEGERGRDVRECDSRPHLGLGRRSEAGRREWAAAALVARGGGASAREERAGGGGGSCEAAAKLGVPL